MTTHEAALAALKDGRYYAAKAERPVKLKTDSGVSLEVPGPALLAATYALPWLLLGADAYKAGSALLTRPHGSDEDPAPIHQGELSEELLAALQRLPQDASAGRPYKDLRIFLTEASPAARSAYLADTIAHLRRLLPAYRPPKERAPRGPAKSTAERSAELRARVRREEELSAREWLEGYLEDADPGERVVAEELFRECAETIEEFVDADEPREDGGAYAVPRQRVFYTVADEVLGSRRRGAHGSARVYLIPTP